MCVLPPPDIVLFVQSCNFARSENVGVGFGSGFGLGLGIRFECGKSPHGRGCDVEILHIKFIVLACIVRKSHIAGLE
jgi:hypothetical protein